MTDLNFEQALAKLNPEQLQAVNALEGPVMVFAGPGTGKTQVLTLRIAKLIATGQAEPTQILALTFTRAAAAEMQTRLTKLIGPTAYQVTLTNFHSFCQEIIESYPEYFPHRRDSRPLDDLEQLSLLEKIIDRLPLTLLRPAGNHYTYLKDIRSRISELKRENVDFQKYQQLQQAEAKHLQALIDELTAKKRYSKATVSKAKRDLVKQQELGLIYQAYEQALVKHHWYDFDDMILSVIDAFSGNSELLSIYQEKYQYVLVDEYQDTNNAQDTIINLLMNYWDQANLFVVGDPQQSIYRFQGANLENFLTFIDRYPQAQVIKLTTGYRCSNKVYQLAQKIIDQTHNQDPRLGEFKSLQNNQGRDGSAVIMRECASEDSEIVQIVREIQAKHQAGVAWEQMAIIFHNNQESDRIMEICGYYGVPVEIEGGANILMQPMIQQLISLLQTLAKLSQGQKADAGVYRWLWQPWLALAPATIIKDWPQLERDKFDRWLTTIGRGDSMVTLYHQILAESNLLTWAGQQPQRVKLLTCLYTFERTFATWEKNRPGLTIVQLGQLLQTMIDEDLKLETQDLNVRAGAVSLTTAHKAKGREWDYVWIYGLNDHVWTNSPEKNKIALPSGIVVQQHTLDRNDEEDRLFYVALTRAKIAATISWHLTVTTDGKKIIKQPSSLVSILDEQAALDLIIHDDAQQLTATEASDQLTTLLGQPKAIDYRRLERAYFSEQVATLSLSPSMLNDYLADPDLFVTRHLLNAPRDETTAAQEFGSSLHLALEAYQRPRMKGGDFLPVSQVIDIFTRDWQAKNLPEPATGTNYLQIGQESLKVYCQQYQTLDSNFRPLGLEKKLGGQPKIIFNHIPLNGKIDKLELIDEATQTVRVTDYKSGQQLSLNELQGEKGLQKRSERERQLPMPIRHPIKRQLLFYKLLCELDSTSHFHADVGMIDFVKLNRDQQLSRLEIDLPDQEITLLKELITQIWQEIKELKFLT